MTQIATNMGIDVSTTGIGIRVRSAAGEEGFISQPFAPTAKRRWHGQLAYSTTAIATLLESLLADIQAAGWDLSQGGTAVCSVRQHDVLLLSEQHEPLGGAISWESDVAKTEAAILNSNPSVIAEVGPMAAHYAVPKAQWLLAQEPGLRRYVNYLCTTGDFIGYQLTGTLLLASSDGRSNGLVVKGAPLPATQTVTAAGLEANWLPEVILSGGIIGSVLPPDEVPPSPWQRVIKQLPGWQIGAALGNNHAGATGFLVSESNQVCLSAGSSGTAVRLVDPHAELKGNVLCMEYFDQAMLLDMLPRCCLAYDAWFASGSHGGSHAEVDAEALAAPLTVDNLVAVGGTEQFPSHWQSLTRGEQAAHLQLSLAVGLLAHTKAALDATAGDTGITECFLTGGLAMSELFRKAIVVGMNELIPGCQVSVSSLKGPGRFQMAARGAMLASMLPPGSGTVANLATLGDNLCPREHCEEPGDHEKPLQAILAPALA